MSLFLRKNEIAVYLVALAVKNLPASAGDVRGVGSIPGWGKVPWRRKWQPTPVRTEEPGGLSGCRVEHD